MAGAARAAEPGAVRSAPRRLPWLSAAAALCSTPTAATVSPSARWGRGRPGGARSLSLHVLVPGVSSIVEGHALADRLGREIRAAPPGAAVTTHPEPLEDPVSLADAELAGERR